jgi:hypothetical protein
MFTYIDQHEVVIDLHERGFNQDFELAKHGIRWVQYKMFIPYGDCTVIEYYRIVSEGMVGTEIIVLGILLASLSIKGILFHRCSLSPACWPGEFCRLIKDSSAAQLSADVLRCFESANTK